MLPAADADPLDVSARRGALRPFELIRPTLPQLAFLADPAAIALWRDGNQLGKTTCILLDLIFRCRGIHPYQRVRRAPIIANVVSFSHEQMGSGGGLHEKLWNLLPRDEIEAGFDPGRGIKGKPPRVLFVRGPGAGSVINFPTYKQGPRANAGRTVDHYVLDEPPEQGFYAETVPRLLKKQGTLRINMTPVLDMPDMAWLRELTRPVFDKKTGKKIRDRVVVEHNYGLNEQACWPVGAPRPWLTQEEIDAFERAIPEIEREMRMGRSWEAVLTERWLTNYTSRCETEERPPAGALLVIGIDHGVNAGKQVAVLIAITGWTSDYPRIWCWDEACSDGTTTDDQDADLIVQMLTRNGLKLADVDRWVGDRSTGYDPHGKYKDNQKLRKALARHPAVGVLLEDMPPIPVVVKYDESVPHSMNVINGMLGTLDAKDRPHIQVHPRCVRVIEGMQKWKGGRQDPVKDALDAFRYAVIKGIDTRRFTATRALLG